MICQEQIHAHFGAVVGDLQPVAALATRWGAAIHAPTVVPGKGMRQRSRPVAPKSL